MQPPLKVKLPGLAEDRMCSRRERGDSVNMKASSRVIGTRPSFTAIRTAGLRRWVLGAVGKLKVLFWTY